MGDNDIQVLVVDDERSIRRFLRTSLSAHGFTVSEAATGVEALQAVAEEHPDLIIMDLSLPDIDGIEVTSRLREWTQTPIIVLSVRNQEESKINALDAGADDYVTKPFGVGELLARIRVSMRHTAQGNHEPVIRLGDLVIDIVRRQVTMKDQVVQLTHTEYELLRVLVQSGGKVLTHRQLLRQVWGPGYDSESHLLRVNISNLRRKIEENPSQPRYLLTESGVGYRISPSEYRE